MHTKFLLENVYGRDSFENYGIMLKLVLKDEV
jgi:hypothetical protein